MRRFTVTEAELVEVFEYRAALYLAEIRSLPEGHSRAHTARACLGTTLILRDELLTVLRANDHGDVLGERDAEIARLREALNRIANLASDWSTCEAHVRTAQVGLHAPGIARAALGEKT